MENKLETAIFGGGCFWCTEAVYEELRGVVSTMPGYAGGNIPNPSYESVCGGNTGHAEVLEVKFDSNVISYHDLLTVFFATHDATTLNRQGHDVGTQYRSIILYTNEQQKTEAEKYIAQLSAEGEKVVTEVQPREKFYPAEGHHKDYFKNNPDKAYCQLVINPKLDKLREQFDALLKSHSS